MTIDDFWNKYNHCPLCESYTKQGEFCDGCKWRSPLRHDGDTDKFYPTDECSRLMNREVDA